MAAQPMQIGSPGHMVKIDENIDTNEAFLVEVERRDAATSLSLIQRHIMPGTTKWSYEWGAYNANGNIGYQHDTVNHSRTFKAPIALYIRITWKIFGGLGCFKAPALVTLSYRKISPQSHNMKKVRMGSLELIMENQIPSHPTFHLIEAEKDYDIRGDKNKSSKKLLRRGDKKGIKTTRGHIHTKEKPCHKESKCYHCGEKHPTYDKTYANVTKEVSQKVDKSISCVITPAEPLKLSKKGKDIYLNNNNNTNNFNNNKDKNKSGKNISDSQNGNANNDYKYTNNNNGSHNKLNSKSKEDEIKRIQWNIRGLQSNLPELQILINEQQPQIICLQETKLNPNKLIDIKHYTTYSKAPPNLPMKSEIILKVINKLAKQLIIIGDFNGHNTSQSFQNKSVATNHNNAFIAHKESKERVILDFESNNNED
ncbi:hypothetical protein HELRODRAFT_158625 [Helobdella robusta]|uniref:Endonuclease/exonuclease/phosphatase domain-containing protein n=1 Tax=Helobdella robusta TaxID=6412 RepID=T1EN11_HELRO|nr:hypothetical protein HELRODRAFT_158625 [Helobdella robusta]ESO12161.1 hypothetical protein HELRODRAFT_158625 [Helobdella robusta]